MLFLKIVFNFLNDFFIVVPGSDPRTKEFLWNANPMHMFLIALGYIGFVHVLGPYLMTKRKPFEIDKIIQCYNVFQIGFNLYIFVGITRAFFSHPGFNWTCMNFDKDDASPETPKIIHYGCLYFISKLLDLLETVFFVLRKKNNQISFLHIYHHAGMAFVVFIYVNQYIASHFTFIVILNSFVHVFMYIYYFMAALKVKNLNLDNWKPRLTQLQLMQFACIAILLVSPILNNSCGISYLYLIASFMQNVFMAALFLNFYRHAYILKAKQKTIESHPSNLLKAK